MGLDYKSKVFTGARKSTVEDGAAAFRALVGNKVKAVNVRVNAHRGSRSACSPVEGLMLSKNASERVVVHEMGHWLEMNNPDIRKAAHKMLTARTKGEDLQWLGKLTGNPAFARHEKARADKFYSPYMGKEYASGYTECVSMALELLYADPIKLAKVDRETFIWIYQLVRP